MEDFIIYEHNGHFSVYLVRAESKQEAWETFFTSEYWFQKDENGHFHERPQTHSSLFEALDSYGVRMFTDGSYGDDLNNKFSLTQALSKYGIEERPDGTFVSTGPKYKDAAKVIENEIRPVLQIGIRSVKLDEQSLLQPLLSIDLEEEPIDAHFLANQHRWQSRRYKALSDWKNALTEILKCEEVEPDSSNKISALIKIAALYHKMNNFRRAATSYRRILKMCRQVENCSTDLAMVHYHLAETLYQKGDHKGALRHYKKVLVLEFDFAEADSIKQRIEELRQVAEPELPSP